MIFTLDRAAFSSVLLTGGQEMGIDPAEVIGRTPHTLFPKEEADFFSSAARRVIESGGPYQRHDRSCGTVSSGRSW